MIEIGSGSRLIDIEKSLHDIYQNSQDEILIPKDFLQKKNGALHDGARLQMIVTWARRTKSKFINFNHAVNLQSLIDDFGRSAVGITALRLTHCIKNKDQTIDRREALVPAIKWITLADEEKYADIIKGRSIELISVSGAKLQYPRPLFDGRSRDLVKSTEGMFKTLTKIFEQINKSSKQIPDSVLKPLASFTHQLFLNTQEHATTDFQGDHLDAHVEGMSVSWNQLQNDEVGDDFKGHQELIDFWNREAMLTGNVRLRSNLKCLQISFFDTGPGFVSKSTGSKVENISLDSEKAELINCLRKNVSSKKQIGAGMGLNLVLMTLQEVGGLIRIRTGRMSVFNSFKQNDYQKDPFDFKDWSSAELCSVEGALVSILLPLR